MTETSHSPGGPGATADRTSRSSATRSWIGDEAGPRTGDHGQTARTGTQRAVGLRAGLTRQQVWRLLLLAVATVLLGTGLGFGVALCWPPQYAARAEILYEMDTGKSTDVSRKGRDIRTQLVLLDSRQVLGPVAAADGLPVDELEKQVSVSPVDSSQVVQIEARAGSRELAAHRAQAIVDRYLQVASRKSPSEVDEYLNSQLADVQKKLVDAREEAERHRDLSAVIDPIGRFSAESDMQNLTAREQQLLTQLDETNVSELESPPPVVIVPPYPVPDPVRPLPTLAAAAGALTALGVAACVVAMLARRWTRR